MDVRRRRACELLRNSDKSIKGMASHLGYNSAFHLSAQFKKRPDWHVRIGGTRIGPTFAATPSDLFLLSR